MERLSILYASALFDLAIKKNAVDEILDQAAIVRDSLKDEQCQKILTHPHIPASEKHKFFQKVFGGRVHEDLLGLLYLAADKNREQYLLPALDELVELIRRHKQIVTAQVSSAIPLDEQQIIALKRMLAEKLGKIVELSLTVDSKLIGGPYIYVDGYYIDWTLKSKLRDLKVHMKEGCSA
ncbi:MAG: ATP synthase F1 subunit delta [Oscillospiraceae bacterium]|nr:ATP synthase F1 subunit delta [Oscillospiraceae bacterium]